MPDSPTTTAASFGTWVKRCLTCDTRQIARSYDQLVAISREHKGHRTTVEKSHVE